MKKYRFGYLIKVILARSTYRPRGRSYKCNLSGGGLLAPEISSPSDLFSFSATRNMARMDDERIEALRDTISSPHGMQATVDEQLSRFRQEPQDVAPVGPQPRLGIGLPMSNIFATFVQPYVSMLRVL